MNGVALLVTTIITAASIVYLVRRIQLLEEDLRLVRRKKEILPVSEIETIVQRSVRRHVREAVEEKRRAYRAYVTDDRGDNTAVPEQEVERPGDSLNGPSSDGEGRENEAEEEEKSL